MRETLRQTMEAYQRLISAHHDPNAREKNSNYSKEARDQRIDEQVQTAGVPRYKHARVFDIQKKKAKIMRRLRADLTMIDQGRSLEASSPDSLPVHWMDGRLYAKWQQSSIPLTIGMVVADLEWGKRYHFDASVPKHIQKCYAVEHAKRDLFRLMQLQIRVYESANPDVPFRLRQGILMENHAETSAEIGFIAERLAYSLLKRLEFDGNVAFKVFRADPYQDAVQKIDLVISVPNAASAAQSEGRRTKTASLYGYQLTVTRKGSDLARKQQQLREVDELIDGTFRSISLVQLDASAIRSAHLAWQKLGSPPGGPYRHLTPDGISNILRPILDEALTHEEVDRLCILASGASPESESVSELVPMEDRSSRLRKPAPERKQIVEASDSFVDRSLYFEKLQDALNDRSARLREAADRLDGMSLSGSHIPAQFQDFAGSYANIERGMQDVLEMRDSFLAASPKKQLRQMSELFLSLAKRQESIRSRRLALRIFAQALEDIWAELQAYPETLPDLLGVKRGGSLMNRWRQMNEAHALGLLKPKTAEAYRAEVVTLFQTFFYQGMYALEEKPETAMAAFRRAAGLYLLNRLVLNLEGNNLGVF